MTEDLFRHLRTHVGNKRMKQEDICMIHKIAYTKTVMEEPVPFAGIMKFVKRKCPMCEFPIEEVIYATDK